MKTKQITITIPIDHHAAIARAAEKSGVSLSKFLGDAAIRRLPKEVRAGLSERKGRGKPKAE